MKTRAMPFVYVLSLATLCLAAGPAMAAGSCAPDINSDGTVNSSDLGILVAKIGTSDPRADLNGNGIVGDSDLTMLLDAFGLCPACPANFDGDGTVDAADRQLLEANYGLDCRGDLSRDGVVGQTDIDILLLAWNKDPDADPRADIDGSGVVDTSDLGLVLSMVGNDCRFDLNGDGEVDTDDLWLLLGCWGDSCPESIFDPSSQL